MSTSHTKSKQRVTIGLNRGFDNRTKKVRYMQKGPYDLTTVTSTKTSLKHILRVLSNYFAIILSRPVTFGADEKGLRSSSDRDGKIYFVALPSSFSKNLKFGHFTSLSCRDGKEIYKKA